MNKCFEGHGRGSTENIRKQKGPVAQKVVIKTLALTTETHSCDFAETVAQASVR